jgi:NhaP-type Na+/H+ or K+/H+ antiporter
MSVLDRYPFNRDEVPTGVGAVLLWWETRSLAYNIVVGLTGIVTIGLLIANSLIRSDRCGIPDPPLFALLLIISYGVMANICYTLGAFAEIVARVTMGKESASKLGRTSFIVGLALSVILTTAPAVVIPLLCLGHHNP